MKILKDHTWKIFEFWHRLHLSSLVEMSFSFKGLVWRKITNCIEFLWPNVSWNILFEIKLIPSAGKFHALQDHKNTVNCVGPIVILIHILLVYKVQKTSSFDAISVDKKYLSINLWVMVNFTYYHPIFWYCVTILN